MYNKILRKISNVLLVCGGICILAAAGYFAATYPWRILLSKFGIELSTELKDPTPIDAVYSAYSSDYQKNSDLGLLDVKNLPDPSPFAGSKPSVDNLTLIGAIKLPKIGVSENVVEGTGAELYYAAGHMRGTAEIGQEGNCVIAGHRDYVKMNPFSYLNKMEIGDDIILEDPNYRYTYKVYRIETVLPSDTWVTEKQEDKEKICTLITCTPRITSTHRLIVFGELVSQEPLEDNNSK